MNRNTLERKYAREDRAERLEVLRALMQHAGGRKFLWWMLEIGKAIGHQPYTRNALDTAFGCGEMNVGNQFLAELTDATGDGLAVLMQEMYNERRERDRELAAAGSDGAADGDGDG